MKKAFVFLYVLNTAIASGQQIATFDSYIVNFREIQTDTVSKDNFMHDKEISKEFVECFVPAKKECECTEEGVSYRYASKVEKSDFIIAIISKVCDITKVGFYPYSDDILIVYSKEGKIIDHEVVSRRGDAWHCYYSGTWDPVRLQIKQASVKSRDMKSQGALLCSIDTYFYTIDDDGKINKTVLSEKEEGEIKTIVDQEGPKRLIVKKSDDDDETLEIIDTIEHFYRSYSINVLRGQDKSNDSLKQLLLTLH